MKRLKRIAAFPLAVLCFPVFILSGCAGLYFREAAPPSDVTQVDLHNLPFSEYWTGLVFDGEKIGFSHFEITPNNDDRNAYRINSEAVLAFHFLMIDKKITLKAEDVIGSDLSLISFSYDHDMDGNRLRQQGKVSDGVLSIEFETAGELHSLTFPLDGKVYPASVIGLYPVYNGLAIGKEYTFMVYDGETRTISEVKQQVKAFEQSDLFDGKAFKVQSRMHGQKVDTWVNVDGLPVLEMALGGVLIAGLENETTAKQYVARAAFAKKDVLLDFSRVSTNVDIATPRKVKRLEIIFGGIKEDFDLPTGEGQDCVRRDNGQINCNIYKINFTEQRVEDIEPGFNDYLQPSFSVPSTNPEIVELAKNISDKDRNRAENVALIIQWMEANIKKEAVDAFTALDVLIKRKGECQGHSFLLAALSRALGIPAKVVNGLVYSEIYKGFMYHTWVEVAIGGKWIPVDPTFGQVEADATHIKFIEGEKIAELLPLVDLVGNIKAKVVSYE